MKRLVSALFLFGVFGFRGDAITLTFDEFAIDSAHQFIDISNYYNGGYAQDAKGKKGPGPNYGLTAYHGSQLVAWGYPSNPSDVGLRIPSFPSTPGQSAPGGYVFSRGIIGSFSFVSEGDTGHTALLVSALDANGHVLAENFVGQDVTTFTLQFPGVAREILLGAPDANHPGPLDAPGYWHFDAVNFTPATGFPAVWRPVDGTWYTLPSNNGNNPVQQQWGLPGDVPIPGDYDGDGQIDFAVWRPSEGTWYIIPSGTPTTPIVQQWGLSGDVPLTGDFDLDGKTDFAVWRPADGTWYIIPSGNPTTPIIQQWGLSGDVPLVGDFDGDGKTDFAVWRPADGTWYVIPSGNPTAPIITQWGLSGDVPVNRAPGS